MPTKPKYQNRKNWQQTLWKNLIWNMLKICQLLLVSLMLCSSTFHFDFPVLQNVWSNLGNFPFNEKILAMKIRFQWLAMNCVWWPASRILWHCWSTALQNELELGPTIGLSHYNFIHFVGYRELFECLPDDHYILHLLRNINELPMHKPRMHKAPLWVKCLHPWEKSWQWKFQFNE